MMFFARQHDYHVHFPAFFVLFIDLTFDQNYNQIKICRLENA